MDARPQNALDPIEAVAFNRAIADHAEGLKTYAMRMLGDGILAEDIAQDAFLALYRHLSQVPAAAFRPWLYRVTRNLCLDHLRRRKFKLKLFRDVAPRDAEERDPVPVDASADRPDEVAQVRETQAAVEAAIQQLPVKFRDAFLLCEMQGLSYEDASAILKCPVKTVSTRLFRARQRFRAAVGDLLPSFQTH
jgi:RNA polymerase sigma-70 factor (ECF subfamily)